MYILTMYMLPFLKNNTFRYEDYMDLEYFWLQLSEAIYNTAQETIDLLKAYLMRFDFAKRWSQLVTGHQNQVI